LEFEGSLFGAKCLEVFTIGFGKQSDGDSKCASGDYDDL
jgi:hypothetical protein